MGRGQLVDAARKGDERSVEKILAQITKRSGPFTSLRRGAGVNTQDESGNTALHHACMRGHKNIVQLLLSVNASPCVVDKTGATPLHLAAWYGDSDVVGMLLAHDKPPVNIDQQTLKQETALLLAAQYGHVSVVAQLIARGADVTIPNINQETALDLAAQYGRLDTVQLLLRVRPLEVQKYKYPSSRSRLFTSTPLHRAAKNGHDKVISVLLSAGFDPNILTPDGTPLHEAACFGKASVVRLLLSKGADLNAINNKGLTVKMILDDYPIEATRNVMEVIREYETLKRNNYESEEDLPPFPVPESPTSYPNYTAMKAPETQKNTNKNESFMSPSSSVLTKNPSQSFVKKLASKCLGLKAKFNSAPNISNSSGLESNVDVSSKLNDQKSCTNTLLIGNSKFFKMLSKKEESGEIVCNDEFDTISLDRLGTLNRDSAVNRSNRSCPGFKTSLPNISENNELSDSRESFTESIEITDLGCDINKVDVTKPVEAVNLDSKFTIFEPRKKDHRTSVSSNMSLNSDNLVNECYESYEFVSHSIVESELKSERSHNIPRPPPRSNVTVLQTETTNSLYENVVIDSRNRRPTPAQRTHIPVRHIKSNEEENSATYENISIKREKRCPTPPKRTVQPPYIKSLNSSPSLSRTSTLSSDSMIDETNLEDIFLSEKSRSFRHSRKPVVSAGTSKSSIHRTASNNSDMTDVSAIENVDCSYDVDTKSMYLSMTGTLPSKKPESPVKRKVLFRHKTFTNIEVDKKYNVKDLPIWNNSVSKDTLANYHIRGTGHCIYKAPTVQEFIYIFNRDTLYRDVPPFSKIPNNTRDSYFETAICFCKPTPPKHHKSAEDLLNIHPEETEEKVTIDIKALKDEIEMVSSSFRCFCDSGICALHANKRELSNNLVVKFSVVKRSISTPDITLDIFSPSSTTPKMGLSKNKSVPSNLEEPYAVVNIVNNKDLRGIDISKVIATDTYVSMSPHSTISSTARPYSIKDISEVISLNSSASTDANQSCASDSHIALRKSSSSEHSGHWSLKSCYSNVTIASEMSFKSCIEESSENSDDTLHSDDDSSDAETIKSDVSRSKRPWVHSDSFRFGNKNSEEIVAVIEEGVEDSDTPNSNSNTSVKCESSKFESGISVEGSGSESSSECGDESVPGADADVSLGASLERGSVGGGVRSGSGRRRWDEAEGTSEGDALSVSSAASSCAPLHLAHHLEYSKVSPTPPKKPPRRNLSVSPTHANSPSSGYSYELRAHARSQDDLDEIQGAKHYLKHGRSVDQYVDGKLSYSEYEENHHSPRVPPVPNPRPSLGLKNRSQPVAITAMYENVVIKEQNPRRKLRRNNFGPQHEENRMTDRVRKYSHQEKSSLESLLDDQSMNSPSDCERCSEGPRAQIPLSPTHYEQPPTPDHPPPSAKQAENSIHERIRPLSQLIMEVVEEIRIRKKSQGDIVNS